MAGSIVQFVEASGATAATSLSLSFTGTAGNQYYVVACSDDATTTYADTLGNTITERTSVIEAAIPRRMHLATGEITTGGATTVTVTFGASVANRQLIAVEVAGVGVYDAAGSQTDTGSNPTTAATATNTAQPAFGVAVNLDYQGGTPTVGTGYTSGGTITGGGLLAGLIEYSNPSYTTTGVQSANFGNAGFNRTCTVFGIFLEGAAPLITAQPTDQTVNAGATATFSVTATGATSYQWQDNSGGSFADITGATSSTYGPTAAYSMQGRLYRCNVTNGSGTTTSGSAQLRVAFNLTGTGPRSIPVMGDGPIAGGTVYSWVRGIASAGALTGQTDEAFTLTDTQTVAAVLAATRGESVALSDGQTAAAVYPVTRAEAVTLSDTQTVAAVYPASRAESVALSDAQTGDIVAISARDEAFTLSDVQSAQVDYAASRAESVALSDSQTAQAVFASTQAEAFTIADGQVVALVTAGAVDEAFTLFDAQTGEIANNTIAESFTLLDGQTAQLATFNTRAESFSLLDAYLTDAPAGVTIAQGNLGFDPSRWEGKQRPRAKLHRLIRQELEAQFTPQGESAPEVSANVIEDLVPAAMARYTVADPARIVVETLHRVVEQIVLEQRLAREAYAKKRAVQRRQQQFILSDWD